MVFLFLNFSKVFLMISIIISYKLVQKHQRLQYQSHDDDDDEPDQDENRGAGGSRNFQSNTIQSSAKTGFSNMSFEDFPSDQEMDRLSRTIPFEVVRNEKMLLEAEKKFGSLKRRNNLFS